ncbi:MAG: hypothetical protein ACTSUE_12010 [Promethearchaeota archaeon]
MAYIISGPMGPEPDAMKVARPVLLNRGITHFPLIYVLPFPCHCIMREIC